jgi:hypothetical protein
MRIEVSATVAGATGSTSTEGRESDGSGCARTGRIASSGDERLRSAPTREGGGTDNREGGGSDKTSADRSRVEPATEPAQSRASSHPRSPPMRVERGLTVSLVTWSPRAMGGRGRWVAAALLVAAACVGDDPNITTPTSGDAGVDASASSPTDAAVEASVPADAGANADAGDTTVPPCLLGTARLGACRL